MKKTLKLVCPVCGHQFSDEHYSSYNFQEENNDLSKILNDSWIKHKCPKCNSEISVIDMMVFHDMKKGLMIYYFPENSGTMESHELFVKKYNYPSNYTIRIVEGKYNDFKEKILLLEYGMNDVAVELYKKDIISKRSEMNDVYEAHLLFDKNSLPQGFVMYQKETKPIIEKFDENKYKSYAKKTSRFSNTMYVHYLLMLKEGEVL